MQEYWKKGIVNLFTKVDSQFNETSHNKQFIIYNNSSPILKYNSIRA